MELGKHKLLSLADSQSKTRPRRLFKHKDKHARNLLSILTHADSLLGYVPCGQVGGY